MGAEWTKLRRKILYHLAIINKTLYIIDKNCRKLVFNNFLLEYYQF